MANERPLEQDQPGDDDNPWGNLIDDTKEFFVGLVQNLPMPDLSWLNPWSESEENQQAANTSTPEVPAMPDPSVEVRISYGVDMITTSKGDTEGKFKAEYELFNDTSNSSEISKTAITLTGHAIQEKPELISDEEKQHGLRLGIEINATLDGSMVRFTINGAPTPEQINFLQSKIAEFVAGDKELEAFYKNHISVSLSELPQNTQNKYNNHCAENQKHCPSPISSLIEDEKTGQHMPLDTPKLAQGASAFQAV